jgi:cytochrome c peroxidase
MMRRARVALVASLCVAAVTACDARSADPSAQGEAVAPSSVQRVGREPLEPLPPVPEIDPRLVALGRRLFHDPRLSADDTLSCASCHDLTKAGDDGRARGIGVHGAQGTVNVLSVFNASLNYVLFWDGRADTLEAQVGSPITSPIEMGSTWDAVLGKLRADPSYAAAFAGFRGGLTETNVRTAIASFERTLLTEDAPLDRWLRGDAAAMTADQVAGYELFKAVGCVACHQGRNVGGNMFQRFGVLGDYFKDRGRVSEADYGRFNVTKSEDDRFVFRVPSLRNVEHTAPYFHDGWAPTLEQAVQVMAKYQLGRALSDDQVTLIVTFLSALTGHAPAAAGGGG